MPFAAPSRAAPLGTDYLGRDVLSRFLDGGRVVRLLALLSTTIGVASGTLVGLVSGYALRVADEVLMRVMDLLLAFPSGGSSSMARPATSWIGRGTRTRWRCWPTRRC
jgi:peptide/nickel transport system permease protein